MTCSRTPKYLLLELVSRAVHSSPTSPDHSSAVTVRFITCSVSEGRTKPDTLWRNSYSQVLVHCWSQCGSSAWGREISAAGCQQSVAHGALLFCRLLVCSAALDTIQQIGCVSVCVGCRVNLSWDLKTNWLDGKCPQGDSDLWSSLNLLPWTLSIKAWRSHSEWKIF